jgi:anti-sigma B factor antagonist
MSLTSTLTNGVKIITVADNRIDAVMAIQFKEDMRSETDGGPDRIILDLSSVDFVDSSGLGAIVASLKQMGTGRRLDLAGLTPTVDKVFRLTRMDTVFNLFPSLDKALATLSR